MSGLAKYFWISVRSVHALNCISTEFSPNLLIFEISNCPPHALPSDIHSWLTDECKITIDINDLKPIPSSGRWRLDNQSQEEMNENRKKIFVRKLVLTRYTLVFINQRHLRRNQVILYPSLSRPSHQHLQL